MEQLKQDIKELIIESLDLEDVSPADIHDDAPLFSDEDNGLGLDSIDALELGLAIKEIWCKTRRQRSRNQSAFL